MASSQKRVASSARPVAGSRKPDAARRWLLAAGCSLLAALSALIHAADAPTSLVLNGGFETADPADATKPLGWQKPDGLGVQWLTALDGDGKVIRMDTAISEQAMVAQWKKVGISEWDIPNPDKGPVAATYGLSFYSAAMPVVKDTDYRFTCRYSGNGGAKIWVRGYGDLGGEKRRLYETIKACGSSGEKWKDIDFVFHPTAHTPDVTEMKVMLYAYWPPGVYRFDNVRVELVGKSAPSAGGDGKAADPAPKPSDGDSKAQRTPSAPPPTPAVK